MASVSLALVSLLWLVLPVAGWLLGSGDSGVSHQTVLGVPVMMVVALVQAALCVLVRTGRNSLRVVLTVLAAFMGLSLLLALVSVVIDLSDAESGPFVRTTVASGPAVFVVTTLAIAVALTVAGLVLLYRRPANAFFAQLRRARG